MSRIRRRLAVVISAVAGLGVLASCGAAPGGETARAANVADCDPAGVRLAVTYPSYGAAAAEAAKPAIEGRHPGLTVELKPSNTVGYDALTQEIVTDIAAGARPDIAMIGTGQVRFWVDQYQPQPIQEGSLKPSYDRRFLEIGTVGDGIYMAPFQVSVPVLYINRDLTARAGITDPPTTVSELLDDARRIKAATGSAPVQVPRDQIADWLVQAQVQSSGLTYVDADGAPGFHSPEGEQALALFSLLGTEGLIDPVSFADAIAAFNTGRLAYFISTPALSAQTRSTVGDAFDWTIADMPVPDGGSPQLPAGGNGWMVLSDDACRAAFSNEMIAEMLAPESVVLSSRQYNYIPVDSAAAATLAADPDAATPLGYAWTYRGTPTPFGGWHGDATPRVNKIIEDMVQQLTTGQPRGTVFADAMTRIETVVGR